MLSELLDELIEDSPFLRRLHQEALAEGETKGRQEGEAVGRAAEARALIREVVRARFAGIAPEELAGVDALADAERLHALALALVSAPDEAAARRALADAKA